MSKFDGFFLRRRVRNVVIQITSFAASSTESRDEEIRGESLMALLVYLRRQYSLKLRGLGVSPAETPGWYLVQFCVYPLDGV